MKSPKTIAMINFKGGVGKTTVTWCLGDVLSTHSRANILLFDLDAQMSLTQAISLDDIQRGVINRRFEKWRKNSIENRRTISDVLDRFLEPKTAGKFEFTPDHGFVYRLKNKPAVYDFVPSIERLYWLELQRKDPELGRGFIPRLLGKIVNSPNMPDYDYVLFDCPPSFTLLSYSVMAYCDLILIPTNPDFFAADGIGLLVEGISKEIQSSRKPKINVFMNRVGGRRRKNESHITPFSEASDYMKKVQDTCLTVARKLKMDAQFLKTWIPARASISRAISNKETPDEFVNDFRRLWREIE